MKKLNLLLIPVILMGLTSCMNDDDSSYHGMSLIYPSTAYHYIYADQLSDSLRFVSYDSFTVTSNASWLIVNKNNASVTLPSSVFMVAVDTLQVLPNTTGDFRSAYITIHNVYKNQDITAVYTQTPFLNILRPSPQAESDNSNKYYFAQSDSSYVAADSLTFTVYGNWTLGVKPDETGTWAAIEKSQPTSGKPGTYTIRYSLESNATGADRSMYFRLTSNGVSTDIRVTQLKPKK
jgi:hypothetical protein